MIREEEALFAQWWIKTLSVYHPNERSDDPPFLPMSAPSPSRKLDLPIRLPAVVFPQPCLYCANVLIDNESLRKRMLPVILAPPKPIQNESPKE